MNTRYKMTLSGKGFFREIEIPPQTEKLRIGTDAASDIRLERAGFFEEFSFTVRRDEEGCILHCTDSAGTVYLSAGDDVRKLLFLPLRHGTEAELRYRKSDLTALRIRFGIDFDYRKRYFHLKIPIPPGCRFTIGADESDSIQLFSRHITTDKLEIRSDSGVLEVHILQTGYGFFHNGSRQTTGKAKVREKEFFSLAEFLFYYDGHSVFTDINDGIRVRGMTYSNRPCGGIRDYPYFRRSVRMKACTEKAPVEIPDPPEKKDMPRDHILPAILPALLMLVLFAAVGPGSGSRFLVFSVCSAGIGAISHLAASWQRKREYRRYLKKRESQYTDYLEEKKKILESVRAEEKRVLEYRYCTIGQLLEQADVFSESHRNIYDRSAGDEDFLDVRLGSGPVLSQRQVRICSRERIDPDDELQFLPGKICGEYRMLQDAPVVLQLRQAGAAGIAGEETARNALVRNMVLDLAIRHHPDDLKLTFILNENQKEDYYWIRFLPHVRTEGKQIRRIACSAYSRKLVFEELYRELSGRAEQRAEEGVPFLAVIVLDADEFLQHPVSGFVPAAAGLGAAFVFAAPAQEALPQCCSSVICAEMGRGKVVKASDISDSLDFAYEDVRVEQAEKAAGFLSPIRMGEVSLENALVKKISLYEVLGIRKTAELDLRTRWQQSEICTSLASPIGVNGRGETVFLDIHENAHGPHGLVAGTTGSGKSELLQSYILSMASLFSPYDVGFLLIDFKGGGMAKQFEKLPHLMGTITNLDGKQISRSLLGIRAELVKRQRIFAEAGVSHIDAYIQKYKGKEAAQAIPHLIIIVDEFAELKSEYPEFMKELISAARIGRSLGVHLILATQKPSGQVDEQIWSNSHFRICLKVQSTADSREMIRSPLAAEIREPGRAWLQVGNNEVFELFQSAYSGAPEDGQEGDGRERGFVISKVSFEGLLETVYTRKEMTPSSIGGGKNKFCQEASNLLPGMPPAEPDLKQSEALVQYLAGYAGLDPADMPGKICAPELEKVIPFPVREKVLSDPGITAEIGMTDDPERQRVFSQTIDLSRENLIIIGSSRSGKTNLLQTIIRSVTEKYSPADVQLFILDFDSMVLSGFADLPHTGGIVTRTEEGKFRRLIKMLRDEIRSRKKRLSEAGATSLAAYREAGRRDLPLIVLMIDNYQAVRELYLDREDSLLPVCRDGLAAGISVVLCSSQTAGLGYRYMGCFSGKIAFFCHDKAEYSALFGHCRLSPEPVPGRGILERDREVFEMQVYLAFPGEPESDRLREVQAYVDGIKKQYPGQHAGRIPEIPEMLTLQNLREEYGAGLLKPDQIPVGLDYEEVRLKWVSPDERGIIALTGRTEYGRLDFLRLILQHLEHCRSVYPSAVFLVDDYMRELSEFRDLEIVKEYTMSAEKAISAVKILWDAAVRRRRSLTEGTDSFLAGEPFLLLVVQNQEAATVISEDPETREQFRELTGRYRKMKTGLIFGNLENAPVSYQSPDVLRLVREEREVYLFDAPGNLKLFDLSAGLIRQNGNDYLPGDCFHVTGNTMERIRIALPAYPPES